MHWGQNGFVELCAHASQLESEHAASFVKCREAYVHASLQETRILGPPLIVLHLMDKLGLEGLGQLSTG